MPAGACSYGSKTISDIMCSAEYGPKNRVKPACQKYVRDGGTLLKIIGEMVNMYKDDKADEIFKLAEEVAATCKKVGVKIPGGL